MKAINYTSSSSEPPPPQKMYILGAGKFGQLAAERLSKRYPQASLLVIDSRMEKLDSIRDDFSLPTRQEDAISFITANDIPDDVWIIPAVPVHVGFQWILYGLKRIGEADMIPVPDIVDHQVPNPYRVPTGTVYTSFATFICPDACNEPDEICTYTRKARAENLFDRLSRIEVPGFDVMVLRSRQLAPGVGGYPAGYLKTNLELITRREGSYIIATSCRCHGVIDSLRWTFRAGENA
jgi:hypothetical protein